MDIRIRIKGPRGAGKSAVAASIEALLRSAGFINITRSGVDGDVPQPEKLVKSQLTAHVHISEINTPVRDHCTPVDDTLNHCLGCEIPMDSRVNLPENWQPGDIIPENVTRHRTAAEPEEFVFRHGGHRREYL